MDMHQDRTTPLLVATIAGAVALGLLVANSGLRADIGQSLPWLLATVAAFVLPGCAAAAVSAFASARREQRATHRAAMAVMEDVAPLEAESVPMAAVTSLTEVQVERRQRERRAARRQQERDSMLAS